MLLSYQAFRDLEIRNGHSPETSGIFFHDRYKDYVRFYESLAANPRKIYKGINEK